jgi:hypothetical protein
MRRSFLSVLALIVLVAESVVAQSTAPPRKLESIPHQLEAHPESLDPLWTIELDSIVQSATIAEIRQVLPALVRLTESPNAQLRGNALLALYAIAGRNKAGLAENHRERDLMAGEAMIPYLSRLEPRLMDPATPSRALSLMLFQALAAVRPTPPELIKAALTVLKSSQSTQPMPDTTKMLQRGQHLLLGRRCYGSFFLLPPTSTAILPPTSPRDATPLRCRKPSYNFSIAQIRQQNRSLSPFERSLSRSHRTLLSMLNSCRCSIHRT